MKNALKLALFTALTAVTAFAEPEWASIYHSLIAFDERPEVAGGNRPGYVKPIATNLGTVLNSNWYASASVPQSLSFEAGMPFALVPMGTDDQEYAGGAPTMFGDKKYEWGTTSATIGSDMGCTGNGTCYVVNGNKNLHNLPLFTYPYLQLAAGFYHARVVLRGMYLPSISELQGFSLFGFGLQYSFGQFIWPYLPPIMENFDVSLVFGMNFSSIGYTPEDYVGELDLDITTTDFEIVFGFKPIKLVELMLHIGYETSSMKSSGHLESHDPDSYGAQIEPTLSVDGNNGFRIGFSVALSLGDAFHPVVGVDAGTKTSFTTNVLYFKQQFGEDPKVEHVQGDVKKNDSNEASEETPLQKKRHKMQQQEEPVDDAVDDEPAENASEEEY